LQFSAVLKIEFRDVKFGDLEMEMKNHRLRDENLEKTCELNVVRAEI